MGTSEIQDGNVGESTDRLSMANALFSGTRQTLLRLLFSDPGHSYTLTQLIELAKAGRGAVQREIARLVEAGLITQDGQHRGRLYRANRQSPIFDELSGIVHKLLGPADILRKALSPLSDRIKLALLYGSVAQHSDGAASDIDVLIVSDDLLLEDVFEALARVEETLGRSINPTVYTMEEFDRRRAEQSPFLSNVLKNDHVILLGSSEPLSR